jgi:hypothetical protein
MDLEKLNLDCACRHPPLVLGQYSVMSGVTATDSSSVGQSNIDGSQSGYFYEFPLQRVPRAVIAVQSGSDLLSLFVTVSFLKVRFATSFSGRAKSRRRAPSSSQPPSRARCKPATHCGGQYRAIIRLVNRPMKLATRGSAGAVRESRADRLWGLYQAQRSIAGLCPQSSARPIRSDGATPR